MKASELKVKSAEELRKELESLLKANFPCVCKKQRSNYRTPANCARCVATSRACAQCWACKHNGQGSI